MFHSRAWLALGLLWVRMAGAATPLLAPPRAPLASSFPGPLWSLLAPEGGTASVANAHLFLRVPGGSNHDALTPTNQAVRLLQPIANVNFDVSIKIDSPVVASDAETSQGLMVVADDGHYLTFAIATDGTSLSLSAHTVSAGVVDTSFEIPGFRDNHDPLFLRLHRDGSAYVAYYSADGNVWTEAGSFRSELVPTAVGPFAANHNANPARAVPVVMAVNWFNIL